MDDMRWVTRIEDDLKQLRIDTKADMVQLGISISNLHSQLTRIEVQQPLTYVTRPDLTERLAAMHKEIDERAQSNREYIQRLESTIQRLLFVIVGALITGGLALLSELFRLLGHTP